MKTATMILFVLISTVALAQDNPYQNRIDNALGQSFATQQNELTSIINELKQDRTGNAYWIAYAQFRSSIFNMATGDQERAEQEIQSAIELVKNIESKSSEDPALLGNMIGYSIAFDPGSAAKLSVAAAAQYRKALKKNENNLRAWLGLGESDFHTPKEYGGGKQVEEYLTKAIALPEQTEENGPTWGKNRAYLILANFYSREGQSEKAKMYCMQGLSKYPQDAQLNQLKNSL